MFAFSEVTTGGVLHVGKLLYVLITLTRSISESEPEPAINSCLELPLPARSADPQIRKMQRYVPGSLVSVGCSAREHGKIA